MDKKTEEILMHDPISKTEKMLGNKHWSEFNEIERTISLINVFESNTNKKDYLKSIGDTYWGMKWDEFKNLIKKHGFIPALEYDVKHDKYIDEFIIYYHLNKGLIICADSYFNKEDVNGGTLYGEIQANSEEDREVIWKWISTGSCIDIEKGIYKTSHDVREGLFSKLNTLESVGEFLPKWTNKDSFLWFVDYTESKKENFDYKEITNNKIKMCPKEFQDIIW